VFTSRPVSIATHNTFVFLYVISCFRPIRPTTSTLRHLSNEPGTNTTVPFPTGRIV